MDDKALASLLEKMKDTSGPEVDEDADGKSQGEDNEGADDDIEDEDEDAAAPADDDVADGAGGTRRRRAITSPVPAPRTWARRAVEVGKLATKPRGALTAREAAGVGGDSRAGRRRQLVVARHTARRVVPRAVGRHAQGIGHLLHAARTGRPDCASNPQAPRVRRRPAALTARPISMRRLQRSGLPKTPEEILALKVCDPACGSGTFPVAALRFLTDALYAVAPPPWTHLGDRRPRHRAPARPRRCVRSRGPAGKRADSRAGPQTSTFDLRLKAFDSAVTWWSAACTGWTWTPLRWNSAGLALSGGDHGPGVFRSRSWTTRSAAAILWWGAGFDRFQDYPALAFWEGGGGRRQEP